MVGTCKDFPSLAYVQGLEERIKTLENKLKNLDNSDNVKKSQFNDLLKAGLASFGVLVAMAKVDTLIPQLQKQATNLSNRLGYLEPELPKIRKQLQPLRKQAQLVSKELPQLRRKADQGAKALPELNRLRRSSSSTASKANRALATANKASTQAGSALSKAGSALGKLAGLAAIIASVLGVIALIQSQLNRANLARLEERVSGLEKLFERYSNFLSQLREELREKFEELRKYIGENQSEIYKLKYRADQNEAQINRLTTFYSNLSDFVYNLESSVKNRLEDFSKNLDNTINNVNNRLNQTTTNINNSTQNIINNFVQNIQNQINIINNKVNQQQTPPKDYDKEFKQVNGKLDELLNTGVTLSVITLLLQQLENGINTATKTTVKNRKCCPPVPEPTTQSLLQQILGQTKANFAGIGTANAGIATTVAFVKRTAEVIGTAASTGTNTIFGWLKSFSKSLYLDKVYNFLSLMLQIHNAAMLSRSLLDSLSFLLDSALNIADLKDEEGNPINISQTLGNSVSGFFTAILGADTAQGLNTTWKKLSAIWTSAVNIYELTLNSMAGIAQGLEIVGEYSGKIGNALKRSGTVLENSYQWMEENVQIKTGRFATVQKVTDNIQDVNEVVDNLTEVTETINETTANITEIQAEFDRIKEAKESGEQAKLESETQSKNNSKSPEIAEEDLIRPLG